MSFELEGTLIEKYDTEEVTATFRKREFVVETSETGAGGRVFTETIKFQLTQDRCNLLDQLQLNERVRVSFAIRGRRWDKGGKVSYFNNLEAFRLEAASAQGHQQTPPPHGAPPPNIDDFTAGGEGDEDLPF